MPDSRKLTARHVLGISGGKDSAALAVYMRGKVPSMEYFFCDTGAELPETYEYLARLETALGKPITRRCPGKPTASGRSRGRRSFERAEPGRSASCRESTVAVGCGWSSAIVTGRYSCGPS